MGTRKLRNDACAEERPTRGQEVAVPETIGYSSCGLHDIGYARQYAVAWTYLWADFLLVFDHLMSWIAIPGNTADFPESACQIHPLSGNEEGVIVGRDFSRLNRHLLKPSKDFLSLLLPKTPSSELRQYAVVADDAEMRPLARIP